MCFYFFPTDSDADGYLTSEGDLFYLKNITKEKSKRICFSKPLRTNYSGWTGENGIMRYMWQTDDNFKWMSEKYSINWVRTTVRHSGRVNDVTGVFWSLSPPH